jgi:hypothetical protein
MTMIFPTEFKNIVPNHQPDYFYYYLNSCKMEVGKIMGT